MTDAALSYQIPGALWSLELPSATVESLNVYAQRRFWSKESAGQLYSADLQSKVIRIDEITKLESTWSSHTRVQLDIAAVKKERADYFRKGLHCLGFWHSHPEPVPNPSDEDIAMAANHAAAGRDFYSGLVFIIVGTAPKPKGLGVWVHDGSKLWQAMPR
jgi:proteasome lid subunit RPN8/RPN11